MKQKIKEALRQEYKSRLELDDDRLDGVAAFASTFVTDESKIEEFVKNEATLAMLKSYQSVLDKDRAKRKGDGDPGQQGTHNGNNPPEPKQQGIDVDALVERLNAAWEQKLQPLQEKLTAFETTRTKEAAVAELDKFCAEWDYAAGFPKERDEARRIALKVYRAGGEQMDGTQLIAAFREEFDPAVKTKGVTDFSQPFQSEGAAGSNETEKNAAFAEEIRNALGMKKG